MVVGVIGLIMPILPGWVFLGFAAVLLFPDAPLTRKSVSRMEHHFPWTRGLLRFFLPDRNR